MLTSVPTESPQSSPLAFAARQPGLSPAGATSILVAAAGAASSAAPPQTTNSGESILALAFSHIRQSRTAFPRLDAVKQVFATAEMNRTLCIIHVLLPAFKSLSRVCSLTTAPVLTSSNCFWPSHISARNTLQTEAGRRARLARCLLL